MKPDSVERIALFDFGSARTKLLVASIDSAGGFSFDRHKEETGLGGAVADSGEISEAAEAAVLSAAHRLKAKARELGCTQFLAVGTDAYRRASNGVAAASRLEAVVGPLAILTPELEGGIFFAAMEAALGQATPLAVMDVGGGSVQIAWESVGGCTSLPTGTFRLEKEFHDGRLPSATDYVKMREHVKREMDAAMPEAIHRDVLVMGSNCMAEFLSAALAVGQSGGLGGTLKMPRTTPARLAGLFEEIRGRRYEELGAYYPNNPRFMFGADKALVNVLAAAEKLYASTVVPTDESVATSLARLAIVSPAALGSFGLRLSS